MKMIMFFNETEGVKGLQKTTLIRVTLFWSILETTDSFNVLEKLWTESLFWRNIIISDFHNKTQFSIKKFYYLKNVVIWICWKSFYFALIHSRLQYDISVCGGTHKAFVEGLSKPKTQFYKLLLITIVDTVLFQFISILNIDRFNVYLFPRFKRLV